MQWTESNTLFGSSAYSIAEILADVNDFSTPGLGDWDLAGLAGHYLRAIRTPLE